MNLTIITKSFSNIEFLKQIIFDLSQTFNLKNNFQNSIFIDFINEKNQFIANKNINSKKRRRSTKIDDNENHKRIMYHNHTLNSKFQITNSIDIKKNETIIAIQFNNDSLINVIIACNSISIASKKIDISNIENENFSCTFKIESMTIHNEISIFKIINLFVIDFENHDFISINETNIKLNIIENSSKTFDEQTFDISNSQTILQQNTIDDEFQIIDVKIKNCAISTYEIVSFKNKFNQITLSNH